MERGIFIYGHDGDRLYHRRYRNGKLETINLLDRYFSWEQRRVNNIENLNRNGRLTRLTPINYTPEEFLEKIHLSLFQAGPENPVMLVYDRHGDKNGWKCRKNQYLEYSKLAQVIQEKKSPILIVNLCCHAHSIVASLEQYPRFASTALISGCSADEWYYGGPEEGIDGQISAMWRQNLSFTHLNYPRRRTDVNYDLLPWSQKFVEGGNIAKAKHRLS